MNDADIATVAALFGDPTRARMLLALMGGLERPASELAGLAHVAPQTASTHLAKLLSGGLVTVRRRGRGRFYRLAGPEVAEAVEALQNLSGETQVRPPGCVPEDGFRFARTCYDHLAGYAAVKLTDALLGHGYLCPTGTAYRVTAPGAAALARLEIQPEGFAKGRRPLAKPCPDWTERRPHLGGALGAALAERLLERRWLVRLDGTRAVHLTPRGLEGLHDTFGVRL